MQDPILPKQADLVLLPPSRRHPISRRVAPTRFRSSAAEYDPALGDRDAYTGRPRRYVWSDGCVYEGEWRKGRPDGRGRFWWPSGATYVGEFRAGRMEGEGAFVGVEGESYCGQWADDRKHGFGEKRYANGDSYRGEWRRNLQDGEGEYRWSNGNEYRGGWRNGVIHGRGNLVLGNGDRYHGVWYNGVPKGKGVLCSSKCSASVCGGECSAVDAGLPKICIWELDGEAGDITCDIVDNVDASAVCKGAWESNEEVGSEAGKSPSWNSSGDGGGGAAGEVKKPGQIVCRGHKNYELIVNLQLGIRYSVGKHSSIMRELSQSDFEPNEKFWTRFPPEGSKNTPPHQSTDFRWEDYCPMVFRHLRELFAIDAVDYMLAICGSDALREFSSPGKSGSFFYLTQDDRFMIKTVKKSEVKVLTRMLPSYYQHVCQYNNTLVTKFFGLHCIKLAGGQKVRFIVMGNLFASEYRIHKRFDLKGSSYGRTTDKGGGEIDETVTLKDLDLNFVFRLERPWYQKLIRQINRDCELLEAEGIMDYSLLVGLHFCDGNWGDEMKMSPKYMQPEEKNVDRDEMSMRGYHLLPNMDWVMESRVPLIRLGTNMHARAERVPKNDLDYFMASGSCNAETGGEVFDVVLYFGIIDILQDYDITKRLEHAYKSLQVDATSISAVDPKLYSRRFRDFIHKIFVADM